MVTCDFEHVGVVFGTGGRTGGVALAPSVQVLQHDQRRLVGLLELAQQRRGDSVGLCAIRDQFAQLTTDRLCEIDERAERSRRHKRFARASEYSDPRCQGARTARVAALSCRPRPRR